MGDGKFKPGRSGNPRGRVPVAQGGTPNKRTKLDQALVDAAPGVQAVVVAAALDGDLTACGLIMARTSAPLRGRAAPVQFELDPEAPVDKQAKQILIAVSRGDVDPDTAKFLFEALILFADARDREALVGQLSRLRQGKPPAQTVIPT